jgi:hypothetical protein
MTRIRLIFTDWYLSVIIRCIRVICVPMFLARGHCAPWRMTLIRLIFTDVFLSVLIRNIRVICVPINAYPLHPCYLCAYVFSTRTLCAVAYDADYTDFHGLVFISDYPLHPCYLCANFKKPNPGTFWPIPGNPCF